KVIKFMKLKDKLMNPAILIAILKDKDHLIPEVVEPKKLTRKDKVKVMVEKMTEEEIKSLKQKIASRDGFDINSSSVNTEFENIICRRFNKEKITV
ncbi:hypothetical protein, partial [Psychrilyobacter sp.]|uniref:hypothetical protein n=1 Tax=Psychrilyobacter sp. TaxID=2586924 RepID=UPI003019A908